MSDAGVLSGGVALAASNPAAPAGTQRIERLQILRAIAAIMVVMFHVVSNYLPAGSVLLRHGFYGLLAGGVDIFFFISGFLIRTTTYATFGRANVVDYLKKRFARVVPYYWLITACVVSLSLIAPGAFRSYQFDWRHAAASFFFIPWQRPDGMIYPPLVQGWSLNFEILFYLIFAALMVWVARERVVTWLAVLFGAAIVGANFTGANPELFIAGNPYVLEFVAGALFADLWRSRRGGFPAYAGWCALALAFALLPWTCVGPFDGRMGIQIVGFAAFSIAFMTLPAVPAPLRISAGLALLGEASYSIYLVHPIVLSPLAQILAKVGLSAHPIVILTIIPALAVAASFVAWRCVEQPLLSLSRRLLGLRQVESTSTRRALTTTAILADNP